MKSAKMPVRIGVILAYSAGLILLLSLGTWQLVRGLEKSAVQKVVTARSDTSVDLTGGPVDWKELIYANVRLQGDWIPERTVLLDNRVYQGRVGVEILTPLELHDGGLVLVNRGWTERATGQVIAPEVINNGLPDNPEGQLYIPQPGFTLGPAYTDDQSFPVLVQYLDMKQLSALQEQPLAEAVLVLKEEVSGFKTIWKPYIVDATRHYGYAAQWWGLGLVMIVFGFIWKKSAKQ